MDDRRRSPRFSIESGELALLPAPVSVQVLDLSSAGALLLASQPIVVGASARLRLQLGGRPISALVEVRRVADAGSGGHQIGVEIVELSPADRTAIEGRAIARPISGRCASPPASAWPSRRATSRCASSCSARIRPSTPPSARARTRCARSRRRIRTSQPPVPVAAWRRSGSSTQPADTSRCRSRSGASSVQVGRTARDGA